MELQPLLQLGEPSKSTERGTNHGRQHGGQRMTPSLAPTRFGNLLENLQQAPRGHGLQRLTLLALRDDLSPPTGGNVRSIQVTGILRTDPTFEKWVAVTRNPGDLGDGDCCRDNGVVRPQSKARHSMAEMTIRLQIDPDSGKKNIVISLRSDEDLLPHEHEQKHRQLVEKLIQKGLVQAGEIGQIVIEREEEEEARSTSQPESLPPPREAKQMGE
jgi:hypothetical protein